MSHWVHGPLLHTASQAWSNDESQNSNTKCLVQLKSNTSMHQAITLFRNNNKIKQQCHLLWKQCNYHFWYFGQIMVFLVFCLSLTVMMVRINSNRYKSWSLFSDHGEKDQYDVSYVFNGQLTEGPREYLKVLFQWTFIKK